MRGCLTNVIETVPSNIRDSKDRAQSEGKVSERTRRKISTNLRSEKVLVSSTAVSIEFTKTGAFLQNIEIKF